MLDTLLICAGCLAAGLLAGFAAAVRSTPRMLARLPQEERLAFARKINRMAR